MKEKQLIASIIILFLLVSCNQGTIAPPTPTSTAPPTPTSTITPVPSPTLTPTSPGPTTVQIMVDGSGDYADLETAIESVSAGSTIILGEGTFKIEGRLDIEKPLTLEGTSRDQTIIVGEGPNYVAEYTSEGLLTIRGITFRREGDYAAAVMVIHGGEIDFSNCRFSNAANAEEDSIGVGLLFLNESFGVVKDCEFHENAYHGIAVLERAKPQIIGNDIHDNGGIGIFFQIDEDGGLARLNILEDNNSNRITDSGTDILVFGPYAPDLASNACSDEGSFGPSSFGDHSGIVFVSRSDLPTTNSVEDNDCAVAWCDTPTGSLLSMECRDHR